MAAGNEDNKWFREINPGFWPGQAFALEIDEILHQQRSKYQDVLVFKSKTYGNVLVLDNCIQCTERDECAYQEMVAFLPLLAHPNPKKVLIIGGGDGGVLREVIKHPQVEQAVLCEIDETVIEVSKKYLPDMAKGFSSSKATIHVRDGFEFLKNNKNQFDVIITDSSDPEAESIWLHLHLIKKLVTINRTIFPAVAYAFASTPTYPSGTIGFLICSLDKDAKLKELVDEKIVDQLDTRYYTAEVHRAAFALPTFVRKELNDQ